MTRASCWQTKYTRWPTVTVPYQQLWRRRCRQTVTVEPHEARLLPKHGSAEFQFATISTRQLDRMQTSSSGRHDACCLRRCKTKSLAISTRQLPAPCLRLQRRWSSLWHLRSSLSIPGPILFKAIVIPFPRLKRNYLLIMPIMKRTFIPLYHTLLKIFISNQSVPSAECPHPPPPVIPMRRQNRMTGYFCVMDHNLRSASICSPI